jgi:hypothetical protein
VVNKRLLVIAFAVVGIVGVILFWWLNGIPPKASVEPQPISSIQPSPQAPIVQTSPKEKQLPGGPYQPSDPRWAEVNARDKIDRAWEWKMPINFYGRVVDENERPVPAAKVHAQWSDLSPNGASSEETFSDSQGSFSITGKTGRGITIRIAKEGYYTPKQQQISFDYAGFWEANYHEADPRHPVTFHLRTKGRTESLTSGEIRPTLSADGTPVRVDLLNGGRISPEGQVEIAAVTNTEKYPPRVFDWQASIVVQDGGLVEYDLEFPFEAPEEGYVPKVEFKMLASAPDWRRSIEKSYFIRIGTPPKYGRIRVRFNGASQKVSFDYAVNPTGSRNLESNTAEPSSPP